MDWAHIAREILTSRGRFMAHISFSSIGIITHGSGSHNESKLTAHITSLALMANGFFSKSSYLYKMTTKLEVHHLIFSL